MLFERIVSEGLAHQSYLLGAEGDALVIDPRRDVDVYVRLAERAGLRIRYVLETHRNEDYVVGSTALAARTGAEVWHADTHLPYAYGRGVEDGQRWRLGDLTLEAMLAPGHTPGMMCYLLRDPSGEPWAVFSGDALLAGTVGRVDLAGAERTEEMAGLLYASLYERILPLGDHVLLCPAHGAGSVCGGSEVADRPWTTLGLERRLNPVLGGLRREEVVARVAHAGAFPPYFSRMERVNLEGAPPGGSGLAPTSLAPAEFRAPMPGAQVLDTRPALAFGAAHIPGALSIWPGGVAAFAGWFVDGGRPLLLVEDERGAGRERARRALWRMGFDDVAGTLAGGMEAWLGAGLESATTQTITASRLCALTREGRAPWMLDVRTDAEREESAIPGSHHVPLPQLPARLGEVPHEAVVVICRTGQRSTTGASLLQRAGRSAVSVLRGGMCAWEETSCAAEADAGR